jgi:hypothetical protein
VESNESSFVRERARKRRVFWAALLIAGMLGVLLPTPNRTYGGAMKMFFIIFAWVGLKALFEWIWCRRK